MPKSRRQLAVFAGAVVVVIVAALLVLGLPGLPGCWQPADSAPCSRVLFLGNSYTSVNDLPSMFARLAGSGGHRVETGSLTAGGATLADHAGSSATSNALMSARWDFVVLQEQSQIPAVEQLRQEQMYPAARQLVAMVRHVGAEPIFFVTWARRDGWPESGLPDYRTMQAAIDAGYLAIAHEQAVATAPVGDAWQTLVGQDMASALWQGDGSHPTTLGTYLAACVFYATIFRQNPEGLTYHAGLSDAQALEAQRTAANTVLGSVSAS